MLGDSEEHERGRVSTWDVRWRVFLIDGGPVRGMGTTPVFGMGCARYRFRQWRGGCVSRGDGGLKRDIVGGFGLDLWACRDALLE